MNENYKGSIELISGLKQKNDVDFPLMEAHAVAVYETDALGETKEIRLDEKLRRLKEESSVSDDTKQEIISAAVDAVFVDETYVNLADDVKDNSTAIFAAETGLDYRVKQLETQIEEGDNKELNIKFEEKESMLYLYEGEELIKPNPDDESVISNVISTTPISGGGGAGAALNYSLKLKILDTSSNLTFLHTDTPKINFIANFTDTTAEEGEDNLVSQSLNFKLTVSKSEGSSQIKIGTFSFVGMSNTNLDYDLTPILSNVNGLVVGDYSISLASSYTQEVGDEATPVTIQSTKKWVVKITQMYLESSFDDSGVKTGSVPLTVTVYGDLNKTIHYTFNGQEDWMKIENAALSNSDYSITIPKQTHGNYPLEIYLTAEVNGTTITSDSLFYDIIFLDENNSAPLIRAVPRAHKGQQYSTTVIDYSVYTPGELLSDVTLAVDGEVVSTLAGVDRSEKEWNYKPMDFGMKTLTITSGKTTRTISFEVEKFPYDITGVTAGLDLDFLPQGRTNQDADYDVFHNNVFDENGNEVPITWTLSENFDWINGGWKTDENGDSYFCIKAGTSVDINYLLFNDEHTLVGANKAKGNGKEFKIIFKTTNVSRPDITWLTCMAEPEIGDPLGIQMDAHTGYIRTSSGSSYLSVPYSEEDKIEFDFNIVPISYNAVGEIDLTIKDIPMIMTYEDGTPVRPLLLDNDQISFKQLNAVPITIGSPYCDVYIYRIKAYSTYLTEKNILNNFIADAPNAEEMINRYVRNQIYDAKTGKLTPESFAEACPDMRVIKISAPRFTNDKKDKVLETTVEMIHRNGDPVLDNWKAVYARHNGQGTSSNAYGYAGRNLELSLKEKETVRYVITNPDGVYNEDGKQLSFGTVVEGKQDFYNSADEETRVKYEDPSTIATVTVIPGTTITLGDGETTTKKVSLTRDSVPTNYFNIKVNIASSEHANNALLQKRYDRYMPYTSYAQKTDKNVKNTMNFYNCVIFIQERNEDLTTHQEFNDNDWHFYSMGNIGDSKKTDDSRANDPDDTTEFCVEIMDWNRELSAFPQDTKVQANASKYVKKDKDGNITEYIFITEDNLKAGILFEKDLTLKTYQEQDENGAWISYGYKVSQDSTIDTANIDKYYVDILEQDDYSEDYTYGFRYLNDDEDEAQIAAAKAKWNEFYRFITRDNYYDDRRADADGKWLEDPAKIAAWKTELENWFIKDAAFYYYLFTLRYTMVDNRAKNSFWHWGKVEGDIYKMDFWDYDNDTALGIDNTGKFTMSYGVEDHDVNDGGAAHFRAHNSTFFVRIADYFADELISYYKDTLEQLDPQVFSSTSLINEFDKWQSEFPEEVWRLQYENIYKRTYVGGYGREWDNRVNPTQIKKAADPQFLTEMMNGKKKYQRRQFERNQDVYMSSKFFGNTVFQDYLKLRGGGDMNPDQFIVKPNGDITITPYLNMYINTAVEHNSTFNHHIKVKAGESVTLKYPTDILEFNYIYGASYLQSLGDLSAMYLRTAELNNGRRLKQIILGNAIEGYNNPNLETVAITSNNKLLEELDVRNMSNLGGNIPITNIPSLRKLYAQGTKYQTVQFANNGLIEEAYLPASINKLVANNLYYLHTLTLEDYTQLQYLLINKCPNIDEFEIVKNAINLKTVRLTDIDWQVTNTDLLNKLLACGGIGEDGVTVVPQSVLTGKVQFASIRQQEIDAYTAAWPNLELVYNDEDIVPQHALIFKNYDGSILYQVLKDQGLTLTAADDPVVSGIISTPVQPDSIDGQYTYIYTGWSPSVVGAVVAQSITFTAQFKPELKKYRVSWYKDITGNELMSWTNENGETQQAYMDVYWGENAEYPGPIPTKATLNNVDYWIFKGWDKLSTNITATTDIRPIWGKCTPSTPITSGVAPQNLTAEDIFGLAEAKSFGSGTGKYALTDGDTIKIQLGYMPTYDGIETVDLITQTTQFSGAESDVIVTNETLFDSDKSFVLAFDFEIGHTSTASVKTLASCYYNNSNGFKITSSSNGVPSLAYKQNTCATPVGFRAADSERGHREICVIRKIKGDNSLYVYTNNRYSYDDIVETVLLPIDSFAPISNQLCLGANRSSSGALSDLFVGKIHYAKLWYADLGADECKRICSWTYEEQEFEYIGTNRYYLAGSDSKTQVSLIAKNLLDELMFFNMDSEEEKIYNAYSDSKIRNWLNNKVLAGLSREWRQIIKPVSVISLLGAKESQGTLTGASVTTNDYIYLPAVAELDYETYSDHVNYGKELDEQSSGYPTIASAADRIKTIGGSDVVTTYWTRSPHETGKYQKGINTKGNVGYYDQPVANVYNYIYYNRGNASSAIGTYNSGYYHGVLLCLSF